MNNISHDSTLGTPPRAIVPLEKACWLTNQVHTHDAHLKSYLRGAFPSVDVDDVVQESYLRTWLANAARPVRSAKAFLFTVARRLAIDSIRRQRKSPIIAVPDLAALEVMDESKDTVEAAAVSDEIAMLAEAIDSLPPRCREIILLRALEDVSQRETAELLDINETSVGNHVHRGILRLQTFFIKRGVIKAWHDKT